MKYSLVVAIILLAGVAVLFQPIKKWFESPNKASNAPLVNDRNVNVPQKKMENIVDNSVKDQIIGQIISEAIQLGDVEKKYKEALVRLDGAMTSTDVKPSSAQKIRIAELKKRYSSLLAKSLNIVKKNGKNITKKAKSSSIRKNIVKRSVKKRSIKLINKKKLKKAKTKKKKVPTATLR